MKLWEGLEQDFNFNAMLIVPKTSRIRDDLAVVVRFFDGDGEAALDYLKRQDPENPSARAPIPGVTIMTSAITASNSLAASP